MRNKLAAVKTNGNSIAQAREVIANELRERGGRVAGTIDQALVDGESQMFTTVQLPPCEHCGHRQRVPLQAVICLPGEIVIEARPK